MFFDAANGHATSLNVKQSMTMDIELAGQTISQTIGNVTEGKFRLAK